MHIDALRRYYEEEARLARRRSPKGPRVDFRRDFVALLEAEQRHSIVDFGAGPASDGPGFSDAGLRYVGIDLARRNGELAAASGFCVVQASMAAPPLRPHSFDAAWSMSALMHLPEDDVRPALESMTRCLRPGSPLALGLWGGERRDEIEADSIEGHQRLFSLRPFDRNRELLAGCGRIERAEVFDIGAEDWEYQIFVVRVA